MCEDIVVSGAEWRAWDGDRKSWGRNHDRTLRRGAWSEGKEGEMRVGAANVRALRKAPGGEVGLPAP